MIKNFLTPPRAAGVSHVGKTRKRNEDAICVDPHGQFAILADGMGGHQGGQEASQLTVAHVQKKFKEFLDSARSQKILPEDVVSFLKAAFNAASLEIYEKSQTSPLFTGMGTTLVTWLNWQEHSYIAHAGDSKAYLIRDNQIFSVTMDDSFVNEQLKSGTLRSQLSAIKMDNAIFKNIGSSAGCLPSVMYIKNQSNDIWLLCSDGLSNFVNPYEMLDTVQKNLNNLLNTCKKLVAHAYFKGGKDNISVILVADFENSTNAILKKG